MVAWSSPSTTVLKFNVNKVASGKPGLAGIGGLYGMIGGKSCTCFPKLLGWKIPMKRRY